MNQIAQIETRKPRELAEVIDPVPMLDTARFEHMQRVATVMARSTLMPESLYKEGPKDNKTVLPYEQILSNCFLVVNQAVRWGLDPFAVAQCVSVVHGKLCYEGKLVSAVLQAKLAINLHHTFIGAGEEMRIYLSDQPITEEVIELLKPGYRRNDMRIFDGSVGEWKTAGNGTPWTPKNFPRMLIYRGTRDWCRIYEPALMLGVYTPDEMEDLEDTSRYQRARDVTPRTSLSERLAAAREAQGEQEGFNAASVARETETLTGGAPEQNSETSAFTPSADAGSDIDAIAPNERVASAPFADDESALESSGGDVASPSSSLDSEIDDESEQPTGRNPAVIRELKRECKDKLLQIAISDLPAGERRGVLERTKNVWKDELPEGLEFVRICFETADKVIKKELTPEFALKYLNGLVGV